MIFNHFLSLFRFIYTGNFKPDAENIMDTLYLARKYILPELENDCVKLAKQFVNKETVWVILEKSLHNSENTICETCLTFIRLNIREVIVDSQAYKHIQRSTLEYVLDNVIFNIKEDFIFHLCLVWAKFQLMQQSRNNTIPNLRDILGPCLFKIQFQNFTVESLTEPVAQMGLLDDATLLQFYKCIGLGKKMQDSDHPVGFELKERPRESVQKEAKIKQPFSKATTCSASAFSSNIDLGLIDDQSRVFTCFGLKLHRCVCVESDTRDVDCFFNDNLDTVKINGVPCLDKITYELDKTTPPFVDYVSFLHPRLIYVFLHLKPTPIQRECLIEIDLKRATRGRDIFVPECIINDGFYVSEDGTDIMDFETSCMSPVHSIRYFTTE